MSFTNTMRYKELLIGIVLVVCFGFLQHLLLQWLPNRTFSLVVIFLFSFLKIIYVVTQCFRKIVAIAHMDLPYHRFLLFIAANVVLIVFSFSVDYLGVYHMDATSFTGLEDTTSVAEEYFKLFYLSLLIFTNMGVANVVPVKIPAEALVMFEAIVSFVTLIFILSDYVVLRDSLRRLKGK